MPLTNKSINMREEVWRQLRINAELTGVPVRDFLAYLIIRSQPVSEGDTQAREQLLAVRAANMTAQKKSTPAPSTLATEHPSQPPQHAPLSI